VNAEATTDVVQPNPPDGQAAPELSDRKYHGEPSMARVKQLLSELFGSPSPAKWIEGLLKVRKGARSEISDDASRAAYERGKAEGLSEGRALGRAERDSELEYTERLAAAREKYGAKAFDAAWRSVRPMIPRAILQDIVDFPGGMDGAFHLSRAPLLCRELMALEPEQARVRFQHFVNDLKALGAI
jgi:hypothetical protein